MCSSITPMKMKSDGEEHVVGHDPENALRQSAEQREFHDAESVARGCEAERDARERKGNGIA